MMTTTIANQNSRPDTIIRHMSPNFIRQQPEYKAIISGRRLAPDTATNIHRLPAGGNLVIPGSVRGRSLRTPDVQVKTNTTCANTTNKVTFTSSAAESIIKSKPETFISRHQSIYHQNHKHNNDTHICSTVDMVTTKVSTERRIDIPSQISKSSPQSTKLAVVSRYLRRPATCPPSTYRQSSNSEIPDTYSSQDKEIINDQTTYNSWSKKPLVLKNGRPVYLFRRNSQIQQDYLFSVRQAQTDCVQLRISGNGISRTKQNGDLDKGKSQARDSSKNNHDDSNLKFNRPSTASLVCQKKNILGIVRRPKTVNVRSKPRPANDNIKTNHSYDRKEKNIKNTIDTYQSKKETYINFKNIDNQFKVIPDPDQEESKADSNSEDLEILASDTGEKHAHFRSNMFKNDNSQKVGISTYDDYSNDTYDILTNHSQNHQNSIEIFKASASRQEKKSKTPAFLRAQSQKSHITIPTTMISLNERDSYGNQDNDTKTSNSLNGSNSCSNSTTAFQHENSSKCPDKADISSKPKENLKSACNGSLTEGSKLQPIFQFTFTTDDSNSEPMESEIDLSPTTLFRQISSPNRAKTALGIKMSPSEIETTEVIENDDSIPNHFSNATSINNDEDCVPMHTVANSASFGPHTINMTDSTESIKHASTSHSPHSLPTSPHSAVLHNKSSQANKSAYDAKLERSAAYIHSKNKTFTKASQYMTKNHGRGLSILNVHYSQTNTGFNDRIIFADLLKSAHVTNAVIADSVYTMERRLYNRRQDPLRCTTFYDRYMRTRPLSGNTNENKTNTSVAGRGNKVCRSKSASSMSTSPRSDKTNLTILKRPKRPQTCGGKSRGNRTVADKEKARRDRIQQKKERLERGYTPTMDSLKNPSAQEIESMLTSCRYLRVQPDRQPWLYEDTTFIDDMKDAGSDEEYFV